MRTIRNDLIEKELLEISAEDVVFRNFILTKRFIAWFFTRYQVAGYSIHYYDSEPDVPAEWDRDGEEWNDPAFKMVWQELVQAHEPKRLVFCNWIDPFGPGTWGWTQEKTDTSAAELLHELLDAVHDPEGRFYVGFGRDGKAFLYFYGRDTMEYDLWFCFQSKQFVYEGT